MSAVSTAGKLSTCPTLRFRTLLVRPSRSWSIPELSPKKGKTKRLLEPKLEETQAEIVDEVGQGEEEDAAVQVEDV